MGPNKASPRKNSIHILPLLVGLAGLGVILAASGFTFAASQETHDPFCASCHTQPESTYYQRSIADQPVDLASYHTGQNTRCIDCHSGPGILGRMQAELLGARNAASWYMHTAVQPARLIFPINDANCLKCHQDVTQRGYIPKTSMTAPGRAGGFGREEGRANHWHQFMARWQAATSNAGTCTSCHSGHITGAGAQNGFLDSQATQSTCDACHQVLRREEGEGG